MTGKRRRPLLPALAGPFGQLLGKPDEKFEFLSLCVERRVALKPPTNWDFEEDISDQAE